MQQVIHFNKKIMKRNGIVILALLIAITKITAQPVVLVSSINPAVDPALLKQGSFNNCIYKFTITVANAPTVLTIIQFTTANTAAADITNYRLWYNTSNDLADATSIAPAIVTALGPGIHIFTLTVPLVLGVRADPYNFFITTDVAGMGISTVSNILNVVAFAAGDFTFIGTAPTLTVHTSAGGNQAIVAGTTADPTGKPKKDSTARDVVSNQIMFLNGYNFDFSGQLASNYVGHLNLYSPQPIKKGMVRWIGFNAGIMKLNYNNNDTVQNMIVRENVSIDPLQTPVNGTKYLKQFNSYTTQIKQTGWSYYIQPLFQLTNLKSPQKIFLHGHLELFTNKFQVTTTISNLRQDSAIFDTSKPVVLRGNLGGNQSVLKNNFIDGYFGGGVTFDLQPYKSAEFFFQPTIGWTTGIPSLSPLRTTDYNARIINSTRKGSGFYLIRSYYIQKLTGASTLTIGVDIRGYLPTYSPQTAVYMGVNINTTDILALVGIHA